MELITLVSSFFALTSLFNLLRKSNRLNLLLFELCSISVVCVIVAMLSSMPVFWLRVAQLFFPAYLLVLPELVFKSGNRN